MRTLIGVMGRIQLNKRRHRTGVLEMRQPRDPLAIAEFCGVKLDPWQERALDVTDRDVIIVASRQAGKGEVATMRTLDMLINKPTSTTVIISRAERQAKRLLRRIRGRYKQLAYVPEILGESVYALELANGSEVLALPGSEETIRGIEAVDLLILDEAALIDRELYDAVTPFLATTDGLQLLMSSARGKRGFFYEFATGDDPDWYRMVVPYTEIPRFSEKWIARQRRRMGEFMFRQEFGCEFLDDLTQLYPTDLVLSALSGDVDALDLPILGLAS